MEINKEREAFESAMISKRIFDRADMENYIVFNADQNKYTPSAICTEDDEFAIDWANVGWRMWCEAKKQATPEGFVLVDKKHTEDWYLDDQEGMWWDVDGIDNSLCDLDPGQVQAIEHKEYLITESNTVYATKVWDESNDQVGFWEFFKTKDEADKAATYCKTKFKGEPVEAQEQSHD